MSKIQNIHNFFPVGIRAGYTNRKVGNSHGPFAKFNLGIKCGDDDKLVLDSRALLEKEINKKIIWLNQCHSSHFVDLNSYKNYDEIKADGSFTTEKNIACSILTADCLPILVSTGNGEVIGAIHAGWRGLSKNIIFKFFDAFLKKVKLFNAETLNCKTLSLLIWLGPCIGKKNYEVGPEVRQVFINKSKILEEFFFQTSEHKWLMDIKQLANEMIINVLDSKKIKQYSIVSDKRCTYECSEDFYSVRKNTTTGRMATLIWKENIST